MTEPNKPLEQMTAKERFDLGISYLKEGRFDEVIAVLKTISTSEPTIYVLSQRLLGDIYGCMGKLNEAITAWSNIRRNDNPKAYAQAQLNLGHAYKSLGKLEQTIKTWSNISHDDNPKAYAGAQFNLGHTYDGLGKSEQAITAWSNIRHDDDPITYAQAQLNLGLAYKKQGGLEQTIKTWSNISHDNDPETYAWAQFNLGVAYKDQDELDQAIETWSNISHDDNPKAYAGAQFNLGHTYDGLGKSEQAITAWSNIHHDDNPKVYAGAQFNLGNTYHAQGKLDQAIKTWSKVRHGDDPGTYARAQCNLGVAYKDQGKLDQAIKTWSKVHHGDDPEAYAGAQFNLGEFYETIGDLKQAKEAYCNAQDFFYYNYGRVKRILECPQKVIEKLRDIAKNTDEILKSLQIIPDFESRVAHYSRASTAFTLFGSDKNPSNFRLSTIRGVNDPTEGLILGKYWNQQGIPETIHTNDTATFISCFTFNHDSLNQFRLYGKEDGREATGVSLVFNEEFFSDQSDVLKFIAGPSADLSSKSEQNKSNETGKTEGDNKKQLIGKSTLYRCIYLDPETGYWTLAQRDKSTFYREHNEDEDTDAKGKWEDYYELISKIEGCVETRLFNKENNEDTDTKGKRGKYHESISTKEEGVETHLLNKENNDDNSVSSILKSIFTKDHLYNKCNKDEKQKILEAIRFTLLPLQYLVKHIAFQEEQECRIMYITQFRDEKIHSNREKQWMYVEYEEPVLPHIDKIWLSPGSAKYQDFFRILLDKEDNDNKVRISQNPFRNKE